MDCNCNPQGGSSTGAPKGTREGPASLFSVDRREPFTKEPVGAPIRCAQLAIAAKWCYVVYNQASHTGAERASETQEAHGREPARPRAAGRRGGGWAGVSQNTPPRSFPVLVSPWMGLPRWGTRLVQGASTGAGRAGASTASRAGYGKHRRRRCWCSQGIQEPICSIR